MLYLPSHYNLWGVLISVVIASFASYVALDLSKRVHGSEERTAALVWWICGSLALGTGIWSMHFVGMMSFTVPITLGYTKLATLASWVAGVLVSAIALRVANREALSAPRLLLAALAMGGGICAMHYLGMAAIDMVPGIVWNPWLVAASGAIAVAASAAALHIFFWLRTSRPQRALAHQIAAAVVMGIAISGMHYTGMAAANFPAEAMCLSAGSLSGGTLGIVVAVLAVLLLGSTLAASMVDVHRRLVHSLEGGSRLQAANARLQSSNEELHKRAYLDSLTGLPNRLLFEDRLARAVSRHGRNGPNTGVFRFERIAVLFVDLDGFKPINDSFGHAAGDEVLIEVGRRLTAVARNSDTTARLGGDEFVLLLEHVAELADCQRLATRILEALARPMDALGHKVQISASVGIVLYPDHGDADDLLGHADAAMYAAKRAGRGTFAVFEPHMDARGRQELGLQNDLRRALERRELRLHYQPKVRSRPGADAVEVIGVEALMRWHHPQRGVVAPAAFIPLAERIGLINSLGEWVIEEACRQIRAWSDQGMKLPVAINLSPYQLRQPDLALCIERSLRRHGVQPSQLLCEVTESAAMEDVETTQRVFEDLVRIGLSISIDDFGTGYSSLSYLRRLPAGQLKIDRSFVSDLETAADARAVVDGIVKLAHALGLSVVAEGVETVGQRAILRELGCDELQGYLFAEPMPAEALRAWVAERAERRGPVGVRSAPYPA